MNGALLIMVSSEVCFLRSSIKLAFILCILQIRRTFLQFVLYHQNMVSADER